MVLADVFEVFVAIVMLFLGGAGWLGQQVKNKQQGAQPRPNRGRGDARVQDEIERFLQEVTGKQAPERKPQEQRQQRPTSEGPRSAEQKRRERTAREEGSADSERQVRERRDAYDREQAQNEKLRQETAARRRRESQQASDRRSVANQPPSQRRPPKVKAKVVSRPASPDEPITVTAADLIAPVAARPFGAARRTGMSRPPAAMSTTSGAAAVSIGDASSMPVTLSELRDPTMIRKAIIMHEVFGKPKALRDT